MARNRSFQLQELNDALALTVLDAPYETACPILDFFPLAEWNNAARVFWLESKWDAFALNNTVTDASPCGTIIGFVNGIAIAAERSVGIAQINSCDYPTWEWQRFYNARHNIGTAHDLWSRRGWAPWYFSAKALGLL